MRNVLNNTLWGIAISILINVIACICINDDGTKESIVLLGKIALLALIPIILGYILTYQLSQKFNTIIYLITLPLFAFNAFLMILGTFLTAILIAFSVFLNPILILNFSYLAIGDYVFYKTVELDVKPLPKPQKARTSAEDILDDNL